MTPLELALITIVGVQLAKPTLQTLSEQTSYTHPEPEGVPSTMTAEFLLQFIDKKHGNKKSKKA